MMERMTDERLAEIEASCDFWAGHELVQALKAEREELRIQDEANDILTRRIAELEAQKKDIQDVRDDLRERLDAVAPALQMAFQIAEMERWNDRFPKIFGVMSKALEARDESL